MLGTLAKLSGIKTYGLVVLSELVYGWNTVLQSGELTAENALVMMLIGTIASMRAGVSKVATKVIADVSAQAGK